MDTKLLDLEQPNTIASAGSFDFTIKIWDINTYESIYSLQENFNMSFLLKLRTKEIMVSGGNGNSISFWNINTFTKEHSTSCCNCSLNGLSELPDHHIAVSGGESSTINIINTENYQRIKQIECKDYITSGNGYSSLYVLNDGTFIYSHKGCFCQISSIATYEILFKLKMANEFRGEAVTSSSNGKYIIMNNDKQGISIFRINFI